MTTFNAIPNSDIDPESPLTAQLFTYLRDNLAAVTEGAPGAPTIVEAALNVPLGLAYLSTMTAAASSSLDFTSGIDSTYASYIFIGENLLLSAGATLLSRMDSDGGASFDSAASSYAYAGAAIDQGGTETISNSAAATAIQMFAGAVAYHHNFVAELMRPDEAISTALQFRGNAINSGALQHHTFYGSGHRGTAYACNAIQFFPASGNFTSGYIHMFGVRKS